MPIVLSIFRERVQTDVTEGINAIAIRAMNR